MPDVPAQPRPNRRARRSVKKPGSHLSRNPAMSALRQLELASRGPIRQTIAAAKDPLTTTSHVLAAYTHDSPMNNPPDENLKVGMICVRFAGRVQLSAAVTKAAGEQAGTQIARPHPCGHWWVLLSTKETSRFCCTVCDLKIALVAS